MIRAIPPALFALVLAMPAALAQQPATATPGVAEAPAAAPAPQPVQPRRFRSPEEGFATFAAAVRQHDEHALLRVLGEAGRRLIRSGDSVADRAARARFTELYEAGHRIERLAPDRSVLVVGADEWPLPIPMRLSGGAWRFDARAGAQELLDRRIGRNELDVIDTLRAIADAQAEYAAGPGRQGGLRAYAQRFFSAPGQRDGLYWPTAVGEAQSPLGPLLAAASAGGYARGRDDAPQPYRGYYFRILTRQGPAAPGGAMDWVVNGRMIGGFAVLAWPASYGSTGWKSFMISHDGVVWERDLGRDTARGAAAIQAFDPDAGWLRMAE
jgi:hypothetical protein